MQKIPAYESVYFDFKVGKFPISRMAQTNFTLPINSDHLSFSIDGIFGSVRITQSDQPGNEILVKLVAEYRHDTDLETFRTCLVNGGGKEYGVGVTVSPS